MEILYIIGNGFDLNLDLKRATTISTDITKLLIQT